MYSVSTHMGRIVALENRQYSLDYHHMLVGWKQLCSVRRNLLYKKKVLFLHTYQQALQNL